MPNPVESHIRLPLDTGNTGKFARTILKDVGGTLVHEHLFVLDSRRNIVGRYSATTDILSLIEAGHDGTSTGFFWFQVPVGASIRARLRRFRLGFGSAAKIDHLTSPRIGLARFTFGGTASGSVITPGKVRTTHAANVATLRLAPTDMTSVTLNGLVWATVTPGFNETGGVGAMWAGHSALLADLMDEEDFADIGPGEGLVFYQVDAGTASDGRRVAANILWDEYDAT